MNDITFHVHAAVQKPVPWLLLLGAALAIDAIMFGTGYVLRRRDARTTTPSSIDMPMMIMVALAPIIIMVVILGGLTHNSRASDERVAIRSATNDALASALTQHYPDMKLVQPTNFSANAWQNNDIGNILMTKNNKQFDCTFITRDKSTFSSDFEEAGHLNCTVSPTVITVPPKK